MFEHYSTGLGAAKESFVTHDAGMNGRREDRLENVKLKQYGCDSKFLGTNRLVLYSWWKRPEEEGCMTQVRDTIEGTLSPKHQITIPAAMRDALGLRPGDKIEFKLEAGDVLELRVKRPNPAETIAAVLAQYDFSALQDEFGDDVVAAVRASRWDDEPVRPSRSDE
jgi:antitoxin PrlF